MSELPDDRYWDDLHAVFEGHAADVPKLCSDTFMLLRLGVPYEQFNTAQLCLARAVYGEFASTVRRKIPDQREED